MITSELGTNNPMKLRSLFVGEHGEIMIYRSRRKLVNLSSNFPFHRRIKETDYRIVFFAHQ